MASIRGALADLVGGAVLGVPGGIGSRLRVFYYRWRGARIASGVRIDQGVVIDSPSMVAVGQGSWIDRYAILIAGAPRGGRETRMIGDPALTVAGQMAIGARCHIGPHTILSGIGGLAIEDEVTIAAGCKVYSLTHHYRSWRNPSDRTITFGSQVEPQRQAMLQGPVRIGRNVGVAVDCLILPGTTIGEDSFVRPGSHVSGSWPPNSLIAGRPAIREGNRYEGPGA